MVVLMQPGMGVGSELWSWHARLDAFDVYPGVGGGGRGNLRCVAWGPVHLQDA